MWYERLERWDTTFFRAVDWQWPEEVIRPVGDVLKRKQQEVDERSDITAIPIIEKISFGGVLTVTEPEERANYKGRLFWAQSGDFVYSKIRAKQGSLCIVPPSVGKVAVSPEYPVYTIDEEQVLPAYLSLVLRGASFRHFLEGLSHGGSTKTRIPPEQFEQQRIPLPPLPVQRAIVAQWQRAQDEARAEEARIETLRQEEESTLLTELNLSLLPPTPRRGTFVLQWEDLERWDTFFHRFDFADLEVQFDMLKLQGMDVQELGEVVNFVSRAWKASDFPQGEFEYVEISQVTKNNGIGGSRPVLVNQAPSRATTRIHTGDLIIATTRPYLGAFTIVPKEYDGTVCSSGFALADGVKRSDVLMEYVLHFLTSKAGLRQVERRMTGGLYPAIVQEELERVKIPLPSLPVQADIVARVHDARAAITDARTRAQILRQQAAQDAEAMILGTMPPPVPPDSAP